MTLDDGVKGPLSPAQGGTGRCGEVQSLVQSLRELEEQSPDADQGLLRFQMPFSPGKGCFRPKGAEDPLWPSFARLRTVSTEGLRGAGGEVGRRDSHPPPPTPSLCGERERESPLKATELFHLGIGKSVKNEKPPQCATTRDRLNRFIYITPRKRRRKWGSQNSG